MTQIYSVIVTYFPKKKMSFFYILHDIFISCMKFSWSDFIDLNYSNAKMCKPVFSIKIILQGDILTGICNYETKLSHSMTQSTKVLMQH